MADAQDLAGKIRAGDGKAVGTAISDAADQARQRAEDLGRQAKDRLEGSRGTAAGVMDSTAERIRQTGMGPADQVADSLHTAADYVRSNDLGTMMSDVGKAIRENPIPSMVAAVALGFVIGAFLRRD